MSPAAKRCFRSEASQEAIHRACGELYAEAPGQLESVLLDTTPGPTHVLVGGAEERPAVLLLPGTGSNAASWFGEVPHLLERHRLIIVDIPGEPGMSVDARLPLGDAHAVPRWLESLREALGLTAMALVGNSLGGWASLRYATTHPQRVLALALLAPSGLAAPRLSFLLRALPLMFLGRFGLRQIQRQVLAGVPLPAEARAFTRLVAEHCRPVTEAVPTFDDEALRRLNGTPLLYVGGEDDRLLATRASAKRLQRLLPNAEVKVLGGVGHVLLDQGPTLATFLDASL